MDIRFEGLEACISAIDELAEIDGLEEAIQQSCALVERSAKEKAPKRTGALRASITSEVSGTRGEVYTSLEYAPYVEFGTGIFAESGGRTDVPWWYKDASGNWHSTSGQKPQPYMRPALDENRDRIMQLLKECLSND